MRSRSQSGFSLMEVVVVLAIVSVLMMIVFTMIEETARTTMFNESHNDLSIMTQRAVNAIQEEVFQARFAFEEDATGSGYRSALQIPGTIPRFTTSLLPIAQTATTILVPDASGERFAGNSLLIARQLSPLTILYDHDGNVGTPDIEFLADRYRFEYIYLSRLSSPNFARSGRTLDLMRSDSVEFADFFQLSSLSAANIQRIAPRIRAAGIERAWNPGQPINTAFYQLVDAYDGVFNPPVNRPQIAIQRSTSLLPGLKGGRISGAMAYSVAFPGTPMTQTIPVYAQPDVSRPDFPAGFEVKIVGPVKNRQVLARVMLMANYDIRRFESQEAFVTTAARF